MRAWIVRAGRNGEREEWALTNGVAGGGFSETPDLTSATTREAVKEIVAGAHPRKSAGFVNNFTAQLWAMRARIADGDIAVMPRKHSGTIALGYAKGGYRFVDGDDPSRRHAVGVEWATTDLPRSVVKQDLLYSLGAYLTVCEVSRNEGAVRLKHLLDHGIDPGAQETAEQVAIAAGDGGETPDAFAAQVDLEQAARDRISGIIGERFAGHPLADLVAEILEVDGYVCHVSPPGADGGADILAGRGPLGLDQPWLVVQVKSQPTPVGDEVVQKLQGAMTRFKANQALLVALGGVSSPAKARLANEQFSVRVWNGDDLLDNLLRVYDSLPDDVRAQLPLKQIWVMVESEE
jgi:restriction system protein